ncbi:MAG: 1-acyl-sn-glycerol-3-phosphate acyltransferase [Saprospiraceae bacterium]|nr:1-acyl-sn-glycerol-3-phosphate acyltransferase [Saprospiraceae bacterium]
MGVIARFILKIWGWKILGVENTKLPKYVIAVVPHTSNWDFPLGLLVRSAAEMDSKYIGKASLFKFPYGFFFRALGGYPVDRSHSSNYVEAVAAIFNSKERFSISIAPEGTRKKVSKLKTGFYFIAKEAKVPILLTKLNNEKKEFDFRKVFYPTDDSEKDLEYIESFFKGTKGIVQENQFE